MNSTKAVIQQQYELLYDPGLLQHLITIETINYVEERIWDRIENNIFMSYFDISSRIIGSVRTQVSINL